MHMYVMGEPSDSYVHSTHAHTHTPHDLSFSLHFSYYNTRSSFILCCLRRKITLSTHPVPTSVDTLDHILIPQSGRIDTRSGQLVQSIYQILHRFVVVASVERVTETKGTVMKSREKRFVNSKVVLGFRQPATEPLGRLGWSPVGVSWEKKHTHYAIGCALDNEHDKKLATTQQGEDSVHLQVTRCLKYYNNVQARHSVYVFS